MVGQRSVVSIQKLRVDGFYYFDLLRLFLEKCLATNPSRKIPTRIAISMISTLLLLISSLTPSVPSPSVP